MKNKELAAIFSRIADALEIRGETGFKIVGYRKVARTLEDLTEDIESIAREGRLEDIPGVGSGTAKKIEEYLKTGHMKKLDEALSGVPDGLFELLHIQNLGGKTIHLAFKQLGVANLKDLKKVMEDRSLARLYGMGEKKVENIRKGIAFYEQAQERIPIYEAVQIADNLITYLKKAPGIGHIAPAGSLRRLRETVGDIDILATGKDGKAIIDYFADYKGAARVLAAGKTKASIIIATESGDRQVDLRIVDEAEYGAALLYFTGSKAHNIRLRSLAKEKGMKISEYGLFRGEAKIAGKTEEEIYEMLDLQFIPPEMREDRGEVELAQGSELPHIVANSDIRGDLHVHSRYSDGSLSLEEIAEAAAALGYDYIAICDHSQSVTYANGLTPDRLEKQMAEIDRLNKKIKKTRLLKGVEVDILQDGRLDFPDAFLKELDFVIASIHTGFKKNVTERMLTAMQNPFVAAIAHPSGRLISRREGYEVDLETVIAGAKKWGVALELNAYYDRLDLNEYYLKMARENGVQISLGTDTHHAQGFYMMRFGVGIARRAWLEKKDILNCLSYKQLKSKVRKKAKPSPD